MSLSIIAWDVRMEQRVRFINSGLVRGILVAAIPFYIITFFIFGNMLGDYYGNKGLSLIISILAGLTIALCDIYLVIIRPMLRNKKAYFNPRIVVLQGEECDCTQR